MNIEKKENILRRKSKKLSDFDMAFHHQMSELNKFKEELVETQRELIAMASPDINRKAYERYLKKSLKRMKIVIQESFESYSNSYIESSDEEYVEIDCFQVQYVYSYLKEFFLKDLEVKWIYLAQKSYEKEEKK